MSALREPQCDNCSTNSYFSFVKLRFSKPFLIKQKVNLETNKKKLQ